MRFATRIRVARQNAGMSQQDLATHLGVTRGAVANWESVGSVAPATKRLQHIAQITCVNFEWLATGRGPAARATAQDDIHALDTEIETVFDPLELRLLNAFRTIPRRERQRVMDSIENFVARKASSRDPG